MSPDNGCPTPFRSTDDSCPTLPGIRYFINRPTSTITTTVLSGTMECVTVNSADRPSSPLTSLCSASIVNTAGGVSACNLGIDGIGDSMIESGNFLDTDFSVHSTVAASSLSTSGQCSIDLMPEWQFVMQPNATDDYCSRGTIDSWSTTASSPSSLASSPSDVHMGKCKDV